MLLAAGIPAMAKAQSPSGADAVTPWQFEGSALLYGEENRTSVVEPVARVTRLFSRGQSLSAQLTLDAITGASPTGAMPSGQASIQTVTTASGTSTTSTAANQIPTNPFTDFRGALGLEWQQPIGSLLTATASTHVSREKDYQSMGAGGTFSLELMHRLTTLTAGASYDRDDVMPARGAPVPLSDGSLPAGPTSNPKNVTGGMVGLSRILTRRWMLGVTVSRTIEQGYLTEPYKVVSLIDGETGFTTGSAYESRPDQRNRTSLLGSSVCALGDDVLHTDYRYYRDDWGVRSHTVDLRYRRDLPRHDWLEPHVRVYSQTAADFFVFGLEDGSPLPTYATSDYRLGPLRSATLGATYGFQVPDVSGEFSVRAEYMRQWGDGHPSNALGVQRTFDLFPPLNVGSLLIGYSVGF